MASVIPMSAGSLVCLAALVFGCAAPPRRGDQAPPAPDPNARAGQVSPMPLGRAADAFEASQTAVLRHYGVNARSRHIRLERPALSVHVLECGGGQPVLMLHGGGACACTLAPLIASLQGEFHIFAVDRPGCGLTDGFDYRGVPLEGHSVEFITGVLDALDLPRATVVGCSMGGLWALHFALNKPERVSGLVLLGAPAGASPETVPPPPAEPFPTFAGIRGTMAARQVADISRVPDLYVQALLDARRLPGAGESWNSLRQRFHEEGPGGYLLRPRLKDLRPDTLFLWGDKDTFGAPTLGHEMAEMAPSARCVVIPDAGHWPWMDQPEECGRRVREFLKRAE